MSKYLTAVDENSDELMHYGVLGMKWHHRQARSYAALAQDYSNNRYYKRTAKKYQAKADAHLAKNAANIKNTGKGNTKYTKLTSKDVERGRRTNKISTAAAMTTAAVTPFAMKVYSKYQSNKISRPHTTIGGSSPFKGATHSTVKQTSKPKQHASVEETAEKLRQYTDAVNRIANGGNSKGKKKKGKC